MTTLIELSNKITHEINNNAQLKDLKHIVQSYNGSDWLDHVCYSEITYNRKQICCDNTHEMLILSWLNQSSKIHDHPEKGCILKVLEGEVIEEIYTTDKNNNPIFITRNMLKQGDIGYRESNKIIHKIVCLDKAVTMHIYADPNYNMNCY